MHVLYKLIVRCFAFFKKISLILYDVHLGSYVASCGNFFNFSYFLGYPPRILGGFTWRLQMSLQLVIVRFVRLTIYEQTAISFLFYLYLILNADTAIFDVILLGVWILDLNKTSWVTWRCFWNFLLCVYFYTGPMLILRLSEIFFYYMHLSTDS